MQGIQPHRILIVEDEPMLAYALQEFLTEAGFRIAGVASRLDSALALIQATPCDAAILDANLRGVSAGPVAEALEARGTPFIVLSGYARDQQPTAFAAALHLQKPCRPETLIHALRGLLAPHAL